MPRLPQSTHPSEPIPLISCRYERELRKLRAELQQKSKDLVDKRLVLQVMRAFII